MKHNAALSSNMLWMEINDNTMIMIDNCTIVL